MEDKLSPPPSAFERFVSPALKATATLGAASVVAIGASLWLFTPSCACAGPKEIAYISMMKSDLRNLQSSLEIHYADHETYSASLSELLVTDYYAEGFPTSGFQPSEGVTVIVDDATAVGFSAHATHWGTLVQCVIFEGGVRPPDRDMPAGEVHCSEP